MTKIVNRSFHYESYYLDNGLFFVKDFRTLSVGFLTAEAADLEIARYASTLLAAYGPQNWWPGKTRFEVIAGAFLTQNTSWKNVEHAMANLRRAGVMNISGIRQTSLGDLELLVRPSGYFRQKARNIKGFVAFLDHRYSGSLHRMLARPTSELRQELLALPGVGPETADSILLYAGNHPAFVVDVYTRRVFARHHIMPYDARYDDLRRRVEEALSRQEPGEPSVAVPSLLPKRETAHKKKYSPSPMSRAPRSRLTQSYNEFHALLVRVGSSHCRKQAQCEGCPLQPYLPRGERHP